MQIAYYDEAGDDGYPQYSSPLFVLTSLYLHHLNWQTSYSAILDFRKQLKNSFSLPIKLEMHTKHFLLDKKPYRRLRISDANKLTIIGLYCDLIASLNLKIINIAIVKPRITNNGYQVLDTALKYSVQRIENDLNPAINPNEKFMIITDPGRIGKMRKTTRRIQKINFIPSRFSPTTYSRQITSLIEDPIQKESNESYFIQLADLVSYIVYLHSVVNLNISNIPSRMASFITPAIINKVY